MTTSTLSPLAANLSGHDLQALRDFAMDAPWEWQSFLLALADLLEQTDNEDRRVEAKAEEAEQSLSELGESMVEVAAGIRNHVKTFYEEFKALKDPKVDDVLADFELNFTGFADDLEKAVEDQGMVPTLLPKLRDPVEALGLGPPQPVKP